MLCVSGKGENMIDLEEIARRAGIIGGQGRSAGATLFSALVVVIATVAMIVSAAMLALLIVAGVCHA